MPSFTFHTGPQHTPLLLVDVVESLKGLTPAQSRLTAIANAGAIVAANYATHRGHRGLVVQHLRHLQNGNDPLKQGRSPNGRFQRLGVGLALNSHRPVQPQGSHPGQNGGLRQELLHGGHRNVGARDGWVGRGLEQNLPQRLVAEEQVDAGGGVADQEAHVRGYAGAARHDVERPEVEVALGGAEDAVLHQRVPARPRVQQNRVLRLQRLQVPGQAAAVGELGRGAVDADDEVGLAALPVDEDRRVLARDAVPLRRGLRGAVPLALEHRRAVGAVQQKVGEDVAVELRVELRRVRQHEDEGRRGYLDRASELQWQLLLRVDALRWRGLKPLALQISFHERSCVLGCCHVV
ncbi:chemotaxis protein [Babesia caballi]|uniref:Chemotaxis protein n=1 Tax=Babesia caballi TaxID=5871 RepID=A0AAV4LTW1_BABCB|nr:chemotaxis protein [Babesia caballi]